MHTVTRNKLLLATFIMTILYAFHYGIPLYASSSFLHQYFGSSKISAIYMVGSLLTLLVSIHFTKYLHRFHTYNFTLSVVIAEILTTLAFSLTNNPWVILFFFTIHFCLSTLLYIIISVFIENLTPHAETGMIRGLFLTLLNLGILVSPFIGAALLAHKGYTELYIISAVVLVPFIYFLKRYFKHMPDPGYRSLDMIAAGKRAFTNINLRGALMSVLLLECFYAVMVIYSPLYLESIGIPLTTYLSAILPIALTPFVIMPYELGIIADNKLGEKELLILGLIIMAITTLSIVVISTTNTIIWAGILIVSRVGASCVETMAFTYYFKKINNQDASLVALIGNMRSVATVIVGFMGMIMAPLMVNYPGIIFIILGLALLLGVTYVLPIKDTK